MQVVRGQARIDAVDPFLSRLSEIGETHGSIVQAVDARYVAGDRHLTRAVELAQRAIEADATIADDPAMELLLYVAGTRQITEALTLGVGEGEQPIVVVVVGGDEEAAASTVANLIDVGEPSDSPDVERIAEWFDITTAERGATDASLEALVVERVCLLTLER